VLADRAGRQALAAADLPAEAAPAVLNLAATLTSALAAPDPDAPLPEAPGGAAPAYVLFTSGSTGEPKGVVVPHRAVLRLVRGERRDKDDRALEHAPRPEDVVLQAAPLGFDAATIEIWGAWLNGARLVAAGREAVLAQDGPARLIRDHGVTWLWLTASLCHRQAEADPAAFAPLRILLTGGEALNPERMARILAACPGLTLLDGYGPTENTTFTTTHRLAPADCAGPVPIGRPVANTRVHLLDADGRLVPPGAVGEICAAGDGLALGYLGRDDLTAAAFVASPDLPGERLYRTGDLGRRRADGVLEFLGRRDGQIKIRGHRVEPEEVEAALAGLPGVRAAAVVAEGPANEPRLAACLVPAPGADPEALARSLRRHLADRLPGWMVPARFAAVDAIPLTASGKTDRRALARLAETAPELDLRGRGEPPHTAAERLVAEAFAALFDRDDIARDDDFHALGGHSLMATRLAARLAETAGVTLPLAEVFRHPVVRDLARVVEALPRKVERIPPAPPAPDYPAGHAQQRLFVLHQMPGGAEAYNMAFVFEFDPPPDPAALERALAALAARHEGLRTGFRMGRDDADGPRQFVLEHAVPALRRHDLANESGARAEAFRRMRRAVTEPFDLERPPLWRMELFALPGSTLALLVMHHILGDGWSLHLLFGELARLYAAERRGVPAGLPPLPIQAKDYAVWQAGQDFSGHVAWWRQRLAGAPGRIALPHDRPAPAARSFRGDSLRRPVAPEAARRLHAAAQASGTTLAHLFLAVFAALLHRLTRQDDLVIGLGVTGRGRPDLEGVVGFFMNLLPIRLRLETDMEFRDLLAQTREAVLAALDHQDCPFDLLVRDLAPRRTADGLPLFNVAFEYQDFTALLPGTAGSGPGEADGAGETGEDGAAQALTTRRIALEEMRAVEAGTAKYDLTLFVVAEPDDGLLLRLEYDTDLLEPETAGAWLEHLAAFARAAAQDILPEPAPEPDPEHLP
ncbi:MAG: condensation domain-containing protein, partial [Desulfovibrionaceae bacterium]